MDIEIYKGKSFKDLCKDIYANQVQRKEQIEVLISDLKPLIKNVNDAMMVVPMIKGYLDTGNTNDSHLVKLASIIQKLITAQQEAAAAGVTSFGLSDAEKKELMESLDAIQNSDKTIADSLTKKD